MTIVSQPNLSPIASSFEPAVALRSDQVEKLLLILVNLVDISDVDEEQLFHSVTRQPPTRTLA